MPRRAKKGTTPKRRRMRVGYMISAVAEKYSLHPQTLRLYEREGLLKPSRSEGNTRLYTQEDLARLEVILSLTRELGVNLAGVEVVLNMRAKMEELRGEVQRFVEFVNQELERMRDRAMQERFRTALVRVGPRVGREARQPESEAAEVKAS
ncbi:MAG: helix-turn-helix transcriptional regulator [Acidobacteria bacterium]|nr:helix-turn-helix transcriptional regulator [Acidobacteriota bacterium]